MTTNGIISLSGQNRRYVPDRFPQNHTLARMTAVFWGDADPGRGGAVYYQGYNRFSPTKDAVDVTTVLNKGTEDVRTYYASAADFVANFVFVATWDSVPLFGDSASNWTVRAT